MWTLFYLLIVINSCAEQKPENADPSAISVGSRDMFEQIGGSAYLKRATQYFVITNNDTSGFSPIFTEAIDDGDIGLDLNLSYSRKNIAHSRQMLQLKQILPVAALHYNLASLTEISIGRLILTGDLAVDVTLQYQEIFGKTAPIIKTADYKKISEFLYTSRLKTDFERLFKPFGLSVEHVSIEKVFFADNRQLFTFSELQTDSLNVPAKILDCITWLKMKQNN